MRVRAAHDVEIDGRRVRGRRDDRDAHGGRAARHPCADAIVHGPPVRVRCVAPNPHSLIPARAAFAGRAGRSRRRGVHGEALPEHGHNRASSPNPGAPCPACCSPTSARSSRSACSTSCGSASSRRASTRRRSGRCCSRAPTGGAALLLYVLYAAGVVFFVVAPALDAASLDARAGARRALRPRRLRDLRPHQSRDPQGLDGRGGRRRHPVGRGRDRGVRGGGLCAARLAAGARVGLPWRHARRATGRRARNRTETAMRARTSATWSTWTGRHLALRGRGRGGALLHHHRPQRRRSSIATRCRRSTCRVAEARRSAR